MVPSLLKCYRNWQISIVDKVCKINHRFTCRDKCLFCLLSCKVCNMQHNSQTNYGFRYRWNSYRENNRKSLRGEEPTPTDFFAHFQRASQTGFINDRKKKISRRMLLKVIIHKVLVTLTIPLVDLCHWCI